MTDPANRRTQDQDRIVRQQMREEQQRQADLRTAFRILERAYDGNMKGSDHVLVLSGDGHDGKAFRVAITKCPGAIEALQGLAGEGGHTCAPKNPPGDEMEPSGEV